VNVRTIPLALLCVLLLPLAAGCHQVSGSAAPGANLTAGKTYYVIRDKQSDATDAVQKDLARRGYVATTGPESLTPSSADCKVLVEDHWMWDITMYLTELKVRVVNAKTGAELASGRSYRPSLERKSPDEMAQEVFDQIFGTTPAKTN
jgi:hypothetical protein